MCRTNKHENLMIIYFHVSHFHQYVLRDSKNEIEQVRKKSNFKKQYVKIISLL